MKINKEIIQKFLEESLETCSEEFDEYEAEHEFSFGFDELSSTCSDVDTGDFRVKVNDIEMEIDEKGDYITVSGDALARYTVRGYSLEGDVEYGGLEFVGGLVECAQEDAESEFSFSIDINKADFDSSGVEIHIA